MADQGKKRGKPPVFKAATIAHVKVPQVELPKSLIEEVIDVLGVADEGWARALRNILPKQANAYLLAKVIVNADNPHRSKKAIARMAAGLSTALEAMGEIGIEQTIVLAILLEKSEGAAAQKSLIEIRNVIEHVRDTAASWIEKYQPRDRRPRNRALELHVGGLMWLFELITGRPCIRGFGGDGGEPRSSRFASRPLLWARPSSN